KFARDEFHPEWSYIIRNLRPILIKRFLFNHKFEYSNFEEGTYGMLEFNKYFLSRYDDGHGSDQRNSCCKDYFC
ncbi:MAG: hypothetical protein ACXW0L_05650, partial [Methylosarcina sp.]